MTADAYNNFELKKLKKKRSEELRLKSIEKRLEQLEKILTARDS